MFGLPDKYKVNEKIDIRNFIPKASSKFEKERLKSIFISAKLSHQIIGEEIPSIINEKYNCSSIMLFEIQVKSIKDSACVSKGIQEMVKAPCIIRFYDDQFECYSFAHKRLNQNDNSKILILDMLLTNPSSIDFPDKTIQLFKNYLDYKNLKTKTNKLCLYLEVMIKAYIISNITLYKGMITLLDSNVWYNTDDVIGLFEILKKLEILKEELSNSILPGEKTKRNIEIKKLIQKLEII